MATIKLVLDKRHKKSNGKYPLTFRITHKRKTCSVRFGFDLELKDWSDKSGFINKKYPQYKKIKSIIEKKQEEIESIILELEDSPFHYDVNEIKEKIEKKRSNYTFNSFADELIQQLHKSGKHGNALSYGYALNSISKYFGTKIKFENINYALLSQYELLLREKGLKTNAIAAYLRSIRAIYNQAINKEIVAEHYYPFRKYKIKHESTQKRALPIEVISKLYSLNLNTNSSIEFARDIFILSFSLRGINFSDLALLTSENIKNDRLIYRRKKTNKIYDIAITNLSREILEKYSGKHHHYLLPILPEKILTGNQLKLTLKNKLRLVNKQIKKLGRILNIDGLNSTYVQRHSYATACKNLGYSNELIAEALGHGYGNAITSIYLDSFDKEKIDAMNETICNQVIS